MSHSFISHARKDDESAQKLNAALKARKIKSWLDILEIKSDDEWEKKVDQALKSANNCILIMSKSTLKSPSVAYEYRQCVKAGIPIFIVLVESYDLTKLPQRLQDARVIDMTQDFEAGVDKLVESITKLQEENSPVLRPAQSSTFLPSRARVTVTMNPTLRDVDPDAFTDLVEKLADVGFENIQVEAKTNG